MAGSGFSKSRNVHGKICRLKFNRLFEESWTESKIGESLVRFQWLLGNSRKKSNNF